MLDLTLRPWKDDVFDPICRLVPALVTPLQLTALAFILGLASCISAAQGSNRLSVCLWLLNRAFDCMDGAVARQRNQAPDIGGFLDLLSDFIVYSLIPIACGWSQAAADGEKYHLWLSIAFVEMSFHINNFVLFFVAAILEKQKAAEGMDKEQGKRNLRELTSVMMRPALIEGTESGILFTMMLGMPVWTEWLCWSMAILVGYGICQRVIWTTSAMT